VKRFASSLWMLVPLLAATLAACSPMHLLSPNPKVVYEAEFATPFASITMVAHGGTTLGGREAWLAFTTREPVLLRDRQLYSYAAIETPRQFFRQACPSDVGPLRNLNLRCLAWEESSQGHSRGKWLLYDPDRGTYWFRSWSHQ
jgi:hypothetical protein